MTSIRTTSATLRTCLWIVIIGLLISGITAFPLQFEIEALARLLKIPARVDPQTFHGFRGWIARVREALQQTNLHYPFLAYATDWLAFAHIMLAILFVGPLRDPVRNRWVIDFGIIACVGVVLLAMICGPIRSIPIGWRCIDCSFGLIAVVPLLICRREIKALSPEWKADERG
jgi:hypothetical protein